MREKIVLVVLLAVSCHALITEDQYELMPPLFHMDNYDNCMMMKLSLFCSFTFELQEKEPKSAVWKIIKEVSEDNHNYRHDWLRHNICVRRSCPNVTPLFDERLEPALDKCYNEKYSKLGLNGTIKHLKCMTSDSKYQIDNYDIIVGFSFVSYVLFVIMASMYEGIARYKPKQVYDGPTGSKVGKLISAFSLPKNWYRLTAPNSPEVAKLSAIQGIRFYNMICVIFSHTVMIALSGPIANPRYTETATEKWLNMFLANGGYAVQTFFVISGWLLSYHFFRIFEGKKQVNLSYVFMAFVNRYVRLTPTMAVMLAFHGTWMVHMFHGPVWDDLVAEETRNCRKNWWTNLLYINNYVDATNMCLEPTWYIATDTQLFILSLLILLVVWRYQKRAKLILISGILIGIFIPAIQGYFNEYDILVRQYPEKVYNLNSIKDRAWLEIYSSGHCNISGYLIGVLFGYFYYKYQDVQVFKKKIFVWLWWSIAYGFPVFIILIATKMYDRNYIYTPLESALYWAFGRVVFALGIAIGIFGITQNIGYFTKWFCEWNAVQVFGRLTYSAYMVHAAMIRMRAGTLRFPLYLSNYQLTYLAIGDVAVAYLMATLLCLFVEMPISGLQKLWLPQINRPKESEILPTEDKEETFISTTKV